MEIYTNWENKLYQKYAALHPELKNKGHYTIWDGVPFPEKYAVAPFKIMVLNKESYDEELEEYSLHEAIAEQICKNECIFKYQKTMRTHLKQYFAVLHLLETKGIKNLSDDDVIRFVKDNQGDDLLYKMFEQVAYINVKKSDGLPNSYTYDLNQHARINREILEEQIRYFNPSIILGGNVVDGIIEDYFEWGEDLYKGENNEIVLGLLKIEDMYIPFVDMFHPSKIKGMSDYYLKLFHAIKEVESKNPGFWASHMNQPCFKE